MKTTVKIDDREFQRTLRQYMQFTRRDLATVVNTKGLFVARGATRTTKKADRKQIQALASSGAIFKIINARRKAEGKPGLYGADMRRAAKIMINRRMSGIAFIKSGWIPAIKSFAPVAEKRGGPRQDRSARQRGKPYGTAKTALPGWNPTAILTNFAVSKTEPAGGRWTAVATAGLQAAIDLETKSMKDYVMKKLAARARSLGIKAAA